MILNRKEVENQKILALMNNQLQLKRKNVVVKRNMKLKILKKYSIVVKKIISITI
jgi:hypothetical protein